MVVLTRDTARVLRERDAIFRLRSRRYRARPHVAAGSRVRHGHRMAAWPHGYRTSPSGSPEYVRSMFRMPWHAERSWSAAPRAPKISFQHEPCSQAHGSRWRCTYPGQPAAIAADVPALTDSRTSHKPPSAAEPSRTGADQVPIRHNQDDKASTLL